MPRLTDEDLERLLRETFADKEKLLSDKAKPVDTLPEATKRRRPVAPILLAAAAVLVILGGILYGVSRGGADPAPPAATGVANASQNASPDAEIWAAAITAITQRSDQAAGLQKVRTVFVMDQNRTYAGAERASQFSAVEKHRITDLVGKAAGVQVAWGVPALPYTAKCVQTVARVSVGEVVDVGDHKQVSAAITFDCSAGDSAVYRVDKVSDTWMVTGTLQTTEVASQCPTPASPRDGC